MTVRQAAVAGAFYPSEGAEIIDLLEQICFAEKKRIKRTCNPRQIIGGIVPHAGYVHSAKEAVHFFNYLKESKEQIETFIILNPSHYGSKYEISLDDHESWNTPLGDVNLDLELMDFLNIPKSADAQKDEHAAEVMIPYLQYFLDYEFKILPITIRKQSYRRSRELAEKIFKANQVTKRKLSIIASTDFSHYERPEVAYYNDSLVLNRIVNNSIRGLYDTIQENDISICGYGPIMTLMFYSRMINNEFNVEILARGNSSGFNNNKDELVVDYVSVLFYN